MAVWQIACGESGRKYDDLFLNHDVMFCGPGAFGPFDEATYSDVVSAGTYSSSKVGQVRSFAKQVQHGDVVLLRSGYRVLTFGIVDKDGYAHDTTFDDVYGWDVEHTHRVVWQDQLIDQFSQIQSTRDLFADRKQIPTFTAVNDTAVLAPLQQLLTQAATRPLKALPAKPPAPMSLDDFAEALFSKGLSYDAVHRVKVTLEKQQRLLKWYNSSGLATDRPSEHEIVAHVILPLMSALGWSEQLLAVEWHKIDLAVFRGTPTDGEHCELVCEAKKFGHGLQDVKMQAEDYVQKHHLTNCKRILLADGGRFYLYRQRDGAWEKQPSGYLNVSKLRTNHLCPVNTSAVDTLVALTPANLGR